MFRCAFVFELVLQMCLFVCSFACLSVGALCRVIVLLNVLILEHFIESLVFRGVSLGANEVQDQSINLAGLILIRALSCCVSC